MNSRLASLHPYPFQKLAELIKGITPPADKPPIRLSLGEPQHPAPAFVRETLSANLAGLSRYPQTRGEPELRRAIAGWATHRFRLDRQPLDPERHVLPVAGTREALFSIAQAVVDRRAHAGRPATARDGGSADDCKDAGGGATPGAVAGNAGADFPLVMMPNPFYQIYEGAALLAGARPYFLNTDEANGYRMDFARVPQEVWARTQLLYVCSPGNPTGAVLGHDDFAHLLELAERHDFLIASDECYSEIYFDEDHPPAGLLQVAAALEIPDFRRCLVFHSLSKRSSLPGLRSGFIAGDGEVIERYALYRTYHGCALPPPTQAASTAAWSDEAHVRENRALYRRKFDAVLEILEPVLDVKRPAAGFYLWPRTPGDDETFTRGLYAAQNVLVLPGRYLSRHAQGHDPGAGRVRLALVASPEECIEGARRIRDYVESR